MNVAYSMKTYARTMLCVLIDKVNFRNPIVVPKTSIFVKWHVFNVNEMLVLCVSGVSISSCRAPACMRPIQRARARARTNEMPHSGFSWPRSVLFFFFSFAITLAPYLQFAFDVFVGSESTTHNIHTIRLSYYWG